MRISITILISTFSTIAYSAAEPDERPLPFSPNPDIKLWPRNTASQFRRRDNDISSIIPPAMKLHGYEDEKFFFSTITQEFTRYGNETLRNHGPPVKAHKSEVFEPSKQKRWLGWIAMGKRSGLIKKQSYTCPVGSSSCLDLSPTICCPSGTVCESIANIGFGDIGCCPSGEQCSGNLASCADGYSKCATEADGGGCCPPGTFCGTNGCQASQPTASFLTTMPTVATGLDICETNFYPCPSSMSYGCCWIGRLCGVTNCPINTGTGTPGGEYLNGATPSPTGPNVYTSTLVSVVPVTPAVVPLTLVSTNVQTTTVIAPTTTNTVLVTNIVTTTITPGTTISVTLQSTTSIVGTTIITSNQDPNRKETTAAGVVVITLSGGFCPTGFYSCAPIYSGGCCRTGRDCGVTDCPAMTTTLTTQTGLTGVITTMTTTTSSPLITDAAGTGSQGTCMAGFHTCPPSLNGGCCPSGYVCALSNCPASTLVGATGTDEGVVQTLASATTSKVGGTSAGMRLNATRRGIALAVVSVSWLLTML